VKNQPLKLGAVHKFKRHKTISLNFSADAVLRNFCTEKEINKMLSLKEYLGSLHNEFGQCSVFIQDKFLHSIRPYPIKYGS